jgi:hypothetical protein
MMMRYPNQAVWVYIYIARDYIRLQHSIQYVYNTDSIQVLYTDRIYHLTKRDTYFSTELVDTCVPLYYFKILY